MDQTVREPAVEPVAQIPAVVVVVAQPVDQPVKAEVVLLSSAIHHKMKKHKHG
jgi:hypothetical protein